MVTTSRMARSYISYNSPYDEMYAMPPDRVKWSSSEYRRVIAEKRGV
jgi:hypothetical protein